MKVKVKAPFMMAGNKYKPGDSVDVDAEKAKDLAHQGLVAKGKEKEVEQPPKDKMVKKAKKKK